MIFVKHLSCIRPRYILEFSVLIHDFSTASRFNPLTWGYFSSIIRKNVPFTATTEFISIKSRYKGSNYAKKRFIFDF